MSIRTGTAAPGLPGTGGGSQNIQQVLVVGHVATGTPPLEFNDGTYTNTIGSTSVALRDGTGAGVDIDATDLVVSDNTGNTAAIFVPADGTARTFVEEITNNTTLETIADSVSGTCMVQYTYGRNFMQLLFHNGNPLAGNAKINFRQAGNQTVAYLTDVTRAAPVSGTYTDPAFTGALIDIPTGHTTLPANASIEPNDAITMGVLSQAAGPYYMNFTVGHILVTLSAPIGVATVLNITWTAFS